MLKVASRILINQVNWPNPSFARNFPSRLLEQPFLAAEIESNLK
jgi:hypothetical protein